MKRSAFLYPDLLIYRIVLVVLSCIIMFPSSALSQNKLNLTLRSGLNIAIPGLRNPNLHDGVGVDGSLAYNFHPNWAVMAGVGWSRFSIESTLPVNNIFEETGYQLGLQFIYPVDKTKIKLILGGACVYDHFQVKRGKDSLISDSGSELGWQAELGISFPIISHFYIIPGLRFRSSSKDIVIDQSLTSKGFSYLSYGAGVSWAF